MNEVMQIRAASWAAMIKQRNDSGLTIREWCAANGIQESVYYYRLNRLRKMALSPTLTQWRRFSLMLRKHQLLPLKIFLFPSDLLSCQFLLLQTQRQRSVSAVETRLWK